MRDVPRPHVLLWAALVAVLLAPLGAFVLPARAAADPLGSVSGTVSASGGPLANAWVTLMPVTPTGDWAGKQAQTTTDRDGR
ncbi:MAG: hypothetical protein MUF09_12230, partial [Candidatus Nanopelagicales bacterium]|nr:hypothetical protein [Candidatus Nanopelagicales bacterium]